jgi:hypothetical protein
MIRLQDIIKEMAMIDPLRGLNKEKAFQEIDVVIQAATDMGLQNPVIWRGTGGIKPVISKLPAQYSNIMYVTGDRQAFRGGTEGAMLLVKKIFKKENVQPVFAKTSRANIQYFGQPAIVILNKPYTIYQSTEIDDIMVFAKDSVKNNPDNYENAIQSGADTYNKVDLTQADPAREIIIDVQTYWLLPDSKLKNVNTYSDVVDYLNSLKGLYR